MAGDANPRRILQIAVDGAVDVLGADVAYVKLADTSWGHEPRYQVGEACGYLGPDFQNIAVRPGQGLAGLVARCGKPMAVQDYASAEGITHHFADVVEREGLRAMACAPIPGAVGIMGLLSAGRRSRSSFGDSEITALADIANCAGVAVQQTLASARRVHLERLQERERLAIELHDSVAQTLFAIGVEVNRSRDHGDRRVIEGALMRIQELATSASSELRERLSRLSEIPDAFAMETVIDAEARMCEKATGASVEMIRRGELRKLSELHEELICNTVREGLRNAAKHARAQLILIHLCYSESEVRVAIQTEGPGSDGQAWSEHPRPPAVPIVELEGSGLALLWQASRRLGGSLELELGDVGESILTLRLPIHDFA
jgi:signal transduction histidine kinase